MSWELLGPSLVVLFELLVFGATIAFIYYFAREPEAVSETVSETVSEAASETGDHAEPIPATPSTAPQPERIPTPVA